MELSKLRKRSVKMQKYRQKLKSLALGITMTPTPKLSHQQMAQKMIDDDACAHQLNTQQVLLTDFNNQVPVENRLYQTSRVNRLYLYFISKVNFFDGQTIDKYNKNQTEQKTQKKITKLNKDQTNSNSTRNNSEDNRAIKQHNHQKIHFNHQNKQKSRLIYISDLMNSIYEQAEKKHEIKKYKINKMQKQIQKLYLDSHECYLLLMETKNMESQNNFCTFDQSPLKEGKEGKEGKEEREEREDKNSLMINLSESIRDRRNSNSDVLTKKINELKQAILVKQNQYRKLVQDEKLLKQEKVTFLKLLLKNGYRQTDGIGWILFKLAKNNQQLYPSDLYNILDNTTRNCLLMQYQNIKSQLSKQNLPTSTLNKVKQYNDKQKYSRATSLPAITNRFSDIPNTNDSKLIYKSTQNYIVDWIRKQRWRVRSLKHKPSLQIVKPKEWRVEEIKRLKSTYSKQQYENILKYIFGSTKYYNRVSMNAVNSTTKSKMEGYHRQDSGNMRVSQQGLSSRNESSNLTRNNTNNSIVHIKV